MRARHFFVTTGTDGFPVADGVAVAGNQMGNEKLIYFRVCLFNLAGVFVFVLWTMSS